MTPKAFNSPTERSGAPTQIFNGKCHEGSRYTFRIARFSYFKNTIAYQGVQHFLFAEYNSAPLSQILN